MGLLRWLKWWFWETRRCAHERDGGTLVNLGLGKVWYCRKCGKCLESI